MLGHIGIYLGYLLLLPGVICLEGCIVAYKSLLYRLQLIAIKESKLHKVRELTNTLRFHKLLYIDYNIRAILLALEISKELFVCPYSPAALFEVYIWYLVGIKDLVVQNSCAGEKSFYRSCEHIGANHREACHKLIKAFLVQFY